MIQIYWDNIGKSSYLCRNFLFSNQNGVGNWALRSPSADAELQAFIDNYDSRMDRHYKVACDKFR